MSLLEVSGPVGAVRIEGKVGQVTKVLYVFMDVHNPLHKQTKCSSLSSVNFQNYFIDELTAAQGNGKMYDFFMEMDVADLSEPITSYIEPEDQYIWQYVRMFQKISKEKKQDKSFMQNLRLHYFDIREYLQGQSALDRGRIQDIAENMFGKQSASHSEVKRAVYHLRNIYNVIGINQQLLRKQGNPKKKPIVDKHKSILDDDFESAEYLIKKMMTRIKHPEVKKLVHEQVKALLETGDVITKNIGEFIKTIKSLIDEDVNIQSPAIGNFLVAISNEVIIYYATLVDIYFIRRILDKDYITNSIAYVGASHAQRYVDFLCKGLDFKITHTSFYDYENATEPLNIMAEVSADYQCTDMTSFPHQFL